MKLKRLVVLIVVFLITGVMSMGIPSASVVCASDRNPEVESATDYNLLGKASAPFPYPKSATDLLQNILYAVKNNLLMDKAFFTAENLEEFIGKSELLNISENDDGYVRIGGRGFGLGLGQDAADKAEKPIGNTFAGGIQLTGQGKKEGGINLGFLYGIIPFEDVEDVFGKGWSFPRLMPSPHRSPPIAPYGNYDIIYDVGDANYKKHINVGFHDNGSLQGILCTIEEKLK